MGGKSKGHVITPEETMRLIEQQQVMNNPNVSNMWGDTSTTFGADGQAQITQTLSPEMQAMIGQQMDYVSGGPNEFSLNPDNMGNNMMQQFSDRFSERMGAPPRGDGFTPPPQMPPQMPPMGQPPSGQPPIGQPPSMGQPPPSGQPITPTPPPVTIDQFSQNKPVMPPPSMEKGMSYADPDPNNGVAVGDGSPKSGVMDKLQQFAINMGEQGTKPTAESELTKALMKIGRR